jgi:hypothetical protein
MDNFFNELAHKFAPTYHVSRNEKNYLAQLRSKPTPSLNVAHPPWKPLIYFSIRKLGVTKGKISYEINYLSIWDWGSGTFKGIAAHQWDTERVAVFISGQEDSLNPANYQARSAYFAAHEGVRLIGLISLDNSCYVRYRHGRKSGPEVFWAEGKHASFHSLKTLEESNAGDTYASPGKIARTGNYELVNAGNLEQPSEAAPWIKYKKGWGPQKVSSVYSKLKNRLWGLQGNTLKPIPIATVGQIQQIQRELDVPQTGQIDENTLQEVSKVVPSDRLWTNQKITEAEIASLKIKRGFDVSEMVHSIGYD